MQSIILCIYVSGNELNNKIMLKEKKYLISQIFVAFFEFLLVVKNNFSPLLEERGPSYWIIFDLNAFPYLNSYI